MENRRERESGKGRGGGVKGKPEGKTERKSTGWGRHRGERCWDRGDIEMRGE